MLGDIGHISHKEQLLSLNTIETVLSWRDKLTLPNGSRVDQRNARLGGGGSRSNQTQSHHKQLLPDDDRQELSIRSVQKAVLEEPRHRSHVSAISGVKTLLHTVGMGPAGDNMGYEKVTEASPGPG